MTLHYENTSLSNSSIFIVRESRRNLRVSLTQKGIVVRVPSYMDKATQEIEIKKILDKFLAKINSNANKHPKIKLDFKDKISILGIEFQLELLHQKTIEIDREKAIIQIPFKYKDEIKQVILKYIALQFEKELAARVQQINLNTISENYNQIEIKNIKSKWGSCSNKKVLTFSSRLLIMPLWVIDYVIVHELCHLVHFDHSKQFWNLVQIHFPKYKQAKEYLKGIEI